MRMRNLLCTCFILLLTVLFSGCAVLGPDNDGGGSGGGGWGNHGAGTEAISQPMGNTAGTRWLAGMMDQYHSAYDVYSDVDAAGNHFTVPAGIGTTPVLNTRFTDFSYSGLSCIQATSVAPAGGTNWGGFYFLNGILPNGSTSPQANWGDVPNAGIDLRGATKLTFYAKGAAGGEQVEFFCGGVGLNGNSPTKTYHDSFMKTSTNVVLTTSWTKYTIDLTGKDLSYVLGGFGFSMTNANQTIYIDQIQYDKSRLNEPRLILSYRTIASTNDFDNVMKGVAYSYDNAMAILAFLAAGEYDRARLVADALIYAMNNDRTFSGADRHMRNAYKAGDISMPAGWTPGGKVGTVPMPSFYTTNGYSEDQSMDSADTGNQAWVMLAWLACYNLLNDSKYLTAAEDLGNWVNTKMYDTRGAGGYKGQLLGYDYNDSTVQGYKSTEHNLDLYAAFKRIYLITGDATWNNRAIAASNFCLSMWNNGPGFFYSGTRDDGVTPAYGKWEEIIPLDAQPWMLLSFRTLPVNYRRGLGYAETNAMYSTSSWGFDFECYDPTTNTTKPGFKDGIWYEGTSQMATAYKLIGNNTKYNSVMNTIFAGRASDGGQYACGPSGIESLFTGFYLAAGEWRYYRREHVGATAWAVIAEKGLNAFWIGTTNAAMNAPQNQNSWFQLTGPDAFPGTVAYACAAVSNANIYVIGGVVNGVITNGVWQYNTNTRVWTAKALMPTKRRSAAAAVVNGKIYVIGGTADGTTPTNVIEAYDPASDTWTRKTSMGTKRYGLTVSVITNVIYVMGGFGANGIATNVCGIYIPANDGFAAAPSMPAARGYDEASTYGNSIFVFGGASTATGQAVNNTQKYNAGWTTVGTMPQSLELFGQEIVSNMIYVIGGIDGYSTHNISAMNYAYNPANGALTNYEDMITPRYAMATCVLNGEIYTIGGFDSTGNATGVVEKYRPFGVGGNSGDPYVVSSSSSSSSVASADGNFNIYEDTTILSVVWDVDTRMDIWSDSGAGMTMNEIYSNVGEGNRCWQITGTGSWMGLGIRVEPLSSYKNLPQYIGGGFMNFMVKGTKGFKIGVKDGNGRESWVTLSSGWYGLRTDNTWGMVSIPLAAFAAIDWTKIQQYFMFVADSSTGYAAGDVCYLDDLYFSGPATIPSGSAGPGVYIGGSDGYWVNGVKTTLPGSGVSVQSVIVSGSDVYAAGYVSGPLLGYRYNQVPCYWKNGVRVDLSVGLGLYSGRAFSVAVSGNDVYVGGYSSDYGGLSCYWKNGVRTDLPARGYSYASSIFVSGSDVYVAGNDNYYEGGSGYANETLCYWKNGLRTDVFTGLMAGYLTSDNVMTEIFVSGSDVYLAGNRPNGMTPDQANTLIIPGYWKNGVLNDLPIPNGPQGCKYGGVKSIVVIGSDVYATGFYGDSSWKQIPCYWKNGVRTDLSVNNGGSGGVAKSIRLAGSDVYVCGTVDGVACYWLNGLRTSLPGGGDATSIYLNQVSQGSGSSSSSGGSGWSTVYLNGNPPVLPGGGNIGGTVSDNGVVYIMGGLTSMGYSTNTMFAYDLANSFMSTKTPMLTPRSYVAGAALNGKVYAIGGFKQTNSWSGQDQSVVEMYDPATDSWTTKASLPFAKMAATSVVYNGKIYVFGGWGSGGTAYADVEVYDPAADTWTRKSDIAAGGRAFTKAVVIGDKIYLIGGQTYYGILTDVLEYTPTYDTWQTVSSMPNARYYFQAGALNNKIYITGGWYNNNSYTSTDVYDPASNLWTTGPDAPYGVSSVVDAVWNNNLYIIGAPGTPNNGVLRLVP